ncbi:hypothetical protein CspHIS471_0702730 [Cutaneotrichosporon sp. HIS471]|nr:hypothetical protein CspHIS471_0702730 [Cutaneotrichosporon sp. HIS471]
MSLASPDGLCSFPNCKELPTVDYKLCDACLGSLCPQHINHPSIGHPCPTHYGQKWSQEAKELNANRQVMMFNHLASLAELDAIYAAEDLRNVECEPDFVPHLHSIAEWIEWAGSFHLNVPITFKDGVQWVARIRCEINSPCGNSRFDLTSSDLATFIIAHELAPRYVPQVFLPPRKSPSSLLFYFVELIKSHDIDSPFDPPMWKRAVRDVAALMAQLSTKSFQGIGSLCFDSKKDIVVGPLHTRHYFHYRAANLKVYSTSADSKLALLDHLMLLVRQKKLHWDSQWDGRTGRTRDPVWAYVMFLEARDIINASVEMNTEQPTFLRHGDDHLGQFLWKEDGSIAGVVDWESSSTVPFAEAFNAPTWIHDSDNYHRRGTRENRSNKPTPQEEDLIHELHALDRQDLANAVRHGRKWHRLDDLLGGNPPGYEGAVGLRRAFNPAADVPASKAEWVKEATVKFSNYLC